MNEIELQGVRDFLLQSVARFPNGASPTMLGLSVKAAGFDLPEKGVDSLAAQLNYLVGANLIARKNKTHTPSLQLYVIASAGDDYLRINHLV